MLFRQIRIITKYEGKKGYDMIHEEKKITKIVEELTIFFFAIGADKISSKIEKLENETKITFCANYCTEYEDNIHSLQKYLNEPKNEAIEDIYWSLAGSGDPGETTQLLLLGMMVDHYDMKHEGNEVELIMYRTIRR